MAKILGVLFILVLLAGAVAAGGYVWLDGAYKAAGPATPDGKPRIVSVKPGATTQAIATSLQQAGAITDANQFRLALRLRKLLGQDVVMKAGEYEVPSGASMEALVSELSEGSPLQYIVVVPEGLSTSQVLKLLSERTWPARRDPKYSYKLAGEAPSDVGEGVLLPGDYAVSRGDTISAVVTRMKNAQQALLAEAWPGRSIDTVVKQWPDPVDADPIKTAEQAVILASVVERESGNAEEQPMIAGALIGRLATGMRLQADATIVYGITKGPPIGRSLTKKEINEKTRWNTYAMDGLPETPICNPGARAIRAVINPTPTRQRYFMADGQGGHLFAETLKEHEKNSAAYWKLRKANEAAGRNTPAVKPAAPSASPKTPVKTP